MADSIESFVQKLQEEGVQAGRAEAQKLTEQAKAQAERILAEARQEAERIVQEAKDAAGRDLQRGREDLELAARDVLLRLRQTLTETLEAVLRRAAGGAMADNNFLTKLLHDVVMQYAEKDSESIYPIQIRVSDEELEAVTDWALREMTQHDERGRPRIDLKGKLKAAGFEYSAGGGTVEVTPESIAAALSEMITPRLREVIDKAMGRKD